MDAERERILQYLEAALARARQWTCQTSRPVREVTPKGEALDGQDVEAGPIERITLIVHYE